MNEDERNDDSIHDLRSTYNIWYCVEEEGEGDLNRSELLLIISRQEKPNIYEHSSRTYQETSRSTKIAAP